MSILLSNLTANARTVTMSVRGVTYPIVVAANTFHIMAFEGGLPLNGTETFSIKADAASAVSAVVSVFREEIDGLFAEIGDITYKTEISSLLTTTVSTISNNNSSQRTIITGIILSNTTSSTQTVTITVKGTTLQIPLAANDFQMLDIGKGGIPLNAAESFTIKAGAASSVSAAILVLREVIA